MAWTTPKTWSTSETVTAAMMNTYVRDNQNALYDGAHIPSCHVYHNANQSINNATETALAFNSERHDNDTMHDTSTNNSRITITTAGIYVVTGCVVFASNGTGDRSLAIRLNGTTTLATQLVRAASGLKTALTVSIPPTTFSASDYLELTVYQTSGGALNVEYDAQRSPEFGAYLIRR